MQLLSIGSFYLGIEKEKFCDVSIKVGQLVIDYQCNPSKSNDKPRPIEGGDGLSAGEIGSSD